MGSSGVGKSSVLPANAWFCCAWFSNYRVELGSSLLMPRLGDEVLRAVAGLWTRGEGAPLMAGY